MAKTLTAAATSVWKRKHGRHETFTVEYKRRYWNGSAYVYEAAWTVLTPSDVPAPGTISWKLDTTTQNTILASNVTLLLDNSKGKWLATAYDPSVFAADAVATLGYEPYMTKFRIQHGYVLDDGTTELVSLFVGYLADYSLRGGNAGISYTIKGSEILLEQADAQNVSDAFTLENCSPATGDGTNKEFLTTSIGVWQISVVQQNGSTKTQGTDYTLSQMDETGAAKITMVTAPTAGHTMKATGRKWKAAQTIETLIGLLCDEAGIGSGVRTINPVIIPGSASGSKTIDSQANWEAGTVLTNIGTAWSVGDIVRKWLVVDDFSDGDYTNNPSWTVVAGTPTISSGKLLLGASSDEIYLPFTKMTGSWEWKWQSGGGVPVVRFIGTSNSSNYAVAYNPVGTLFLLKNTTAQASGSTVLGSAAVAALSTERTLRVTRSSDGEMKVYYDGVLKITATDTSVASSTEMRLGMGAGGGNSNRIDDLYFCEEVDAAGTSSGTAVWESAIQDILSTPTAWGTLDKIETLNGGTITYATASSTDGASWDAYADIVGGVIQSALKRYFKVRVTIVPATASLTSPVCSQIVANFSVSAINLSIAIFKGKTCFSAIQDLAKIADYEWGFEGDGDFFFRSKTVSGAAVMDLDQDNGILDLSQYKPGWDKIINAGQVKYGDKSQYYAEYNGVTAGEAEPTSDSRFSTRPKSESMNYLLANDLNLGTARARLLYQSNYLPRARANISLWMTPQVDLSDIVSVSYFNDPKMRAQVLGDALLTYGDDFLSFGDPMNVVMRDKRMKVVGVSYNIADGTTDLELLEVL